MKKHSAIIILQRQASAVQSEGDAFDQFAASVQGALRSRTSPFDQGVNDAIQKNGSILRGGLSHFLSTPLKSDKDEIITLIEESIRTAVEQSDAAPQLGSASFSLWKVMDPQQVPLQRQMVGVMKRLLKNGRSILAAAGAVFGKNSGEIGVALFEYDGFSTVQSVAGLTKSALPQDALAMVNGALFTTVRTEGDEPWTGPHLVSIDCTIQDDAVIPFLSERFALLAGQFGIRSITLSRQALRFGSGEAFQIRIGTDLNNYALGSILVTLTGENAEVEDAVTNSGAVTVLERCTP
ncbi:MAG: hypothetical protein KBF97_05760 [Bacteroidetes bacterium]|nr:hypothetical protein [Bacteroidota bacterium]